MCKGLSISISETEQFLPRPHRCSAHEKKKRPNLCTSRKLEPPLPFNFSYRIFRNSAIAPDFSQ